MQTDELIRQLLATGQMNEDTAADLGRMLAEFEAGTLHADDAAYVAALHARVTGSAPLESVDVPVPHEAERIDGLSIAEWRERALRAEADLAALQESLASPASS